MKTVQLAWHARTIVFMPACLYAVLMLCMIRFLLTGCAVTPLPGTTVLLTVVLLLVTACGEHDANNAASTGAQTEPPGKTRYGAQNALNLALATAIPSLDPLYAGSHESSMLIGALYDRLYRYALLARPYRLLPQAASGWPEISADGLHYTISLRADRSFHPDPKLPTAQSGRSLVADDVVYSLLRHFDPALQSPWRWLWAGRIQGLDAWSSAVNYDQPPAGLQVVAPDTLRITLTRPQSDFAHLLAHPSAAIVMRAAVEHHGDTYGLHAIGSGPYRLQDLSLSGITLLAARDHASTPIRLDQEGFVSARHSDYGLTALAHRSAPLLDRIEIVIQRNADQRLQALRAGRIDALLLEPEQYIGPLQATRDDAAQAVLPVMLTADWWSHWYLSRQPSAQWLRIDFNLHSNTLGTAADADTDAHHLAARCALRANIDWHSFNRRFFHATGYVRDSVVSPVASPAGITATAGTNTSLTTNLQVLLKAPLKLLFAHVDSRRNRAYFDWFSQQLSAAGLAPEQLTEATFDNLGELLQAYRTQQWPLLFPAWSLDLPTATNTLQLYAGFNANHRTGGPGLANHENPVYDHAFAHLAATPVSAAEDVRSMQDLLQRACVTSAGLVPAQIHLWNRRLIAWPDAAFAAGEWLRFAALAENQHNE